MKATLEFQFPEDRDEFHFCIHAEDHLATLGDIRETLRSIIKHTELPASTHQLLSQAYQDLCQMLEE